MHTSSKRITRGKQNYYTLQTKFPHAANTTPARCKQKNYTLQTNSCTLQTKFHHATNKIIKRCKKKKKLSHTANNNSARCKKASAHCKQKRKYCAQDDVKDWDLISCFSRFTTSIAQFLHGCHEN